MRNILIVQNIYEAEDCVKKGLCLDSELYSTHSSVDIYLRELYDIRCRCLSSYLSIDEIIRIRKSSYDIVNEVLDVLENEVTSKINRAYGLNMRYFHTLYDYTARYHFSIYIYFVSAIINMLNSEEFDKLYIYDHPCNYFLNVSTSADDLLRCFLPDSKLEKIYCSPRKLKNEMKGFSQILKGLKRPIKASRTLRGKLSRKRTIKSFEKMYPSKKTVMMSEPLSELSFLLDEAFLKKHNIIYFNENNTYIHSPVREEVTAIDIVGPSLKGDYGDYAPYVDIFLKDIYQDILSNISDYIRYIKYLAGIHNDRHIDLAIWGSDPVFGKSALRNEFLRSMGVKVLGAQHGGLYGETPNMQYEAAFERCDYFIGYGYSQEDLKRVFPDKEQKAKILPLGKVNFTKSRRKRKKIDILYPITNTISMFEGGMHRFPPDRLTERQINLLKYLNTLTSCTVYVKPFINAGPSNLSVFPVMKKMKNLKICSDLLLNEFLEKYDPRAVVIELPSQPLYETLHLDTEIFLLGDMVLPWDKQALNELKKRVHYSENTDEIIAWIDSFLNNRLEKRRDQTYFQHYVFKEHTKKNIIALIDNLVVNDRQN